MLGLSPPGVYQTTTEVVQKSCDTKALVVFKCFHEK